MQPPFEQKERMSKKASLQWRARLTYAAILEETDILAVVNTPQFSFEMKQILKIVFVDVDPR